VLIKTPFGFWPAIFLAYRSYHPNLLIVVCISYYSFVRSLSPRECHRWYLCDGDAEAAHLQEIFCPYAPEMQKMRIFKKYSFLPLLSGGWVEGDSILFINKILLQKVVYHLPPIHLRGKVGCEPSTYVIRKSVLCWTLLLILPSATGKRHHLERREKQRKEHSLNALIEVVGLQKVEKASFFQLC
jgi:hypothetical protein